MYYDYNNNIKKGQDMQHSDYLIELYKYIELKNTYEAIQNTINLLQKQMRQTEQDMYKATNNLIPIEHRYLKQLGFDTQNYSEWGQAQAELREGKQPSKENR
jgi:hypothetical protein